MAERKWIIALKASLQMKPSQRWIAAQNAKETERAAARDATRISHSCTTVAWTDKVLLNKIQMDKLDSMIRIGWQIYGIAFSLEERAYAVACKHVDGTCGVLYPTGELDRGSRWTLRKIDEWATESTLEIDHLLKTPPPVSNYAEFVPRREPEQFPSNAVQISRLYQEHDSNYSPEA